ncbi:MAG: hypothetical protein B7X41_17600 [Microbacterium sp. 14-71-5]|nr:MAG: hypothetical protein B7X41_17600 [Microbacterium sp. 14-71-5]
MLIGVIRSTETRDVTLVGDDLDALRAELEAQATGDWVVTASSVEMARRSTELTLIGRLANWVARETEADDREALHAKVPDGFKLISMRRV